MSADSDNPNADLIQGLRAVADWMESQPDAPAMSGFVHGRADRYGMDAREELARFAGLLDYRVREEVSYSDVQIVADGFGDSVRVVLCAGASSIGGQQPTTFEYDPILDVCPACGGAGCVPGEGVPAYGPGCDRCDGAGRVLAEPKVPLADAFPETARA